MNPVINAAPDFVLRTVLSLSSLSCWTCGDNSDPKVAVAIKHPPFSPFVSLFGGVGWACASPTAISNDTEKIQEHIDYTISVAKDGEMVFGPIPLTHTSVGSVKIPIEFNLGEGLYSMNFSIEGILFQPSIWLNWFIS